MIRFTRWAVVIACFAGLLSAFLVPLLSAGMGRDARAVALVVPLSGCPLLLNFLMAFARGAWPKRGLPSPAMLFGFFVGGTCLLGAFVSVALAPFFGWWLLLLGLLLPLLGLLALAVDVGVQVAGYWLGDRVSVPEPDEARQEVPE